jgi:hypothetical protein
MVMIMGRLLKGAVEFCQASVVNVTKLCLMILHEAGISMDA